MLKLNTEGDIWEANSTEIVSANALKVSCNTNTITNVMFLSQDEQKKIHNHPNHFS
jgi:hypothetical protein